MQALTFYKNIEDKAKKYFLSINNFRPRYIQRRNYFKISGRRVKLCNSHLDNYDFSYTTITKTIVVIKG